jgi:tetratricopeptide (TPR) repeat protein
MPPSRLRALLKEPRLRALLAVVAVFVLSRLTCFLAGVRFDAGLMPRAGHYIDIPLLRANLLQCIYYLHCQPPLLNLFIGTAANLFPTGYVLVCQIVYVLLGLLLAVTLCATMIRLGVSPTKSAVLTCLFTAGPASVLYENFLFYTCPVTVMLGLSVLSLHRYLSRERPIDAFAFFGLLGLVVLTRSLFHLGWLLFAVLLLLLLRPTLRRPILAAAAAPVLLVLALYVKNLAVFGEFTSSTWLGWSLSKMTMTMPLAERQELVHQGKLSQLALMGDFIDVSTYRPYVPARPLTGIPVLDQEHRASGLPNYNHPAFIDIFRQDLRDALYIIRTRPKYYLRSLLQSWASWSMPANDHTALARNSVRIPPLNEFYSLVFSGKLSPIPHYQLISTDPKLDEVGFFTIIAFLVVFIFGVGLVLGRSASTPADPATRATVLFMLLTMLYVMLVGNFLEVGENNRFRYMIEPMLIIMLGLFLERNWSKLKRWFAVIGAVWAVACAAGLVVPRVAPNRRAVNEQVIYPVSNLIAAGRADEARPRLNRALSLDSSSVRARFLLACLLNNSGKFDSAEQEFRHAVRLAPDDVGLRTGLVEFLTQAGRLNPALSELQELARRYPFYPEAHNYLGLTFHLAGRLDSAIAESWQAVQLDPRAPELHYNLAGALLDAGGYRAAIESFEQALGRDTAFAQAMAGLALAYERLGVSDSAAIWQRRAARLWSDVRAPARRYPLWD